MPAPIGCPVLSSSRYSPITFLPTLWPVRPILKMRFQMVMPRLIRRAEDDEQPPTTRGPGRRRRYEVMLP